MSHVTNKAPIWDLVTGHSEMEETKESEELGGLFCSQTSGVSVLREPQGWVSDYSVSVFLIRFPWNFLLPGLHPVISCSSLVSSSGTYSWLGDLHNVRSNTGCVFLGRTLQPITCEILAKPFLVFKPQHTYLQNARGIYS